MHRIISCLFFAAVSLFITDTGLVAQADTKPAPDIARSINNETTIDGETMLIGLTNREGFNLPHYRTWFDSTYNAYPLDGATLDELKTVADNLDVVVYLGTWCEDSQREVPALYKVLDYLSVGEDKVFQVCVDRSKEVPSNLLKIETLEFVPTIVFYENGKEAGRIVEFPNYTIEKDLINMLLK